MRGKYQQIKNSVSKGMQVNVKWDLSENEPQGQSDKNTGYIKTICGGNIIKGSWCTFESIGFIGGFNDLH